MKPPRSLPRHQLNMASRGLARTVHERISSASLEEETFMPDREMPTRLLGKTGERVSMLGLGGSHIGQPTLSSREAIRIIRSAIDRGLSFMDNSWDYNEGQSEIRLGKGLKDGYRKKAF